MSDDMDDLGDIDFSPIGDNSVNEDKIKATTQTEEADNISTNSIASELEEMNVSNSEIKEFEEDKAAEDLETVFDVPVRVSVVLGRAKMPVSKLLKMDVGTVVELDRQVGEPIDIFINDRLVSRGEIVLIEGKLGVTMTEIIKAS